jgi:hypothetical protein
VCVWSAWYLEQTLMLYAWMHDLSARVSMERP